MTGLQTSANHSIYRNTWYLVTFCTNSTSHEPYEVTLTSSPVYAPLLSKDVMFWISVIFVFCLNLSPNFCFSRMLLIYFQNIVFPLRIGRISVTYTIPSVIFPKSRDISCFSWFFLTKSDKEKRTVDENTKQALQAWWSKTLNPNDVYSTKSRAVSIGNQHRLQHETP